MNDVLDQGAPTSQSNLLTALGISYLKQSYPWIRFIGMLGIISGVAYMIMAFFAGSIMSVAGSVYGEAIIGAGIFAGLFYFAMGAFITYLSYLLYGYGTKLKVGIAINDPGQIERALKDHKNYFLITGVLFLIGLCFVGIVLVFGIIAGIAGASM
jgi:hypothetical protein